MICDSLDNTRRSYIDSLRRNTVKVPEEQAERYHNLKDKQERRVINLMHNITIFIAHLMLTTFSFFF